MFAIIESGGKQYKVAKDAVLKLEKLQGDAGATVELGNVLLVADEKNGVVLGNPTVEGASVSAEIIAQDRDEKVIIFKKKRRHNYRRKKGHRQYITVVRITGINASGATKKKAAPKAEAAAEEKAAPKKTAKKKEA